MPPMVIRVELIEAGGGLWWINITDPAGNLIANGQFATRDIPEVVRAGFAGLLTPKF